MPSSLMTRTTRARSIERCWLASCGFKIETHISLAEQPGDDGDEKDREIDDNIVPDSPGPMTGMLSSPGIASTGAFGRRG